MQGQPRQPANTRRPKNTKARSNFLGYMRRTGGARGGRIPTLNETTQLKIPVTWYTVYQAVGGTAVAQAITVNTSSVFASYPNFTAQIGNLFAEYRVDAIRATFAFVPGVAHAGLYPSGLFICTYNAVVAIPPTIADIARCQTSRLLPAEGLYRVDWRRDNTIADQSFNPTTAALPVVGGISGYIGASAPTSTAVYLTVTYYVEVVVRGRRT